MIRSGVSATPVLDVASRSGASRSSLQQCRRARRGIAPGIGECRPHSLRRGYIGDRTHGPFRGDPFTGRMRKHSGEAKKSDILVDCRGLDCCDLISAKALADNVQTARQRGVAEGAVSFTVEGGSDRGNKRLLWIGQFRLRASPWPSIRTSAESAGIGRCDHSHGCFRHLATGQSRQSAISGSGTRPQSSIANIERLGMFACVRQ
jgi:hypothetical protein